jgi:hypothetical protein
MALFGLFKKAKKPPAAPNYQQVQQKQAEADTETTQQQLQLNNPTQVNPFGTQTTTYDETGTPTVTQKLTDDAQSALTAQQQTQKMLAESGAAAAKRYQDMISQPFNPNLPGIQTSFNQGGNIMSDPNQRFGQQSGSNKQFDLGISGRKEANVDDDFMFRPMGGQNRGQQSDSQGFSRQYRRPDEEEREPEMTFDAAQTRANSDAWRERVNQKRMAGQQPGGGVFDQSASGDFTGGNIMLDSGMSRYGDATGSFDRGGNIMSDPNIDRFGDASGNFTGQQARTDLDLSNVAKMPVNAGMTGQQAIMARLDPQIQRMDERARQRLANQGLTYGGEAYNRAMGDVNQSSNDLLSQAALQGIGLDMSANQQGYNQALSNAGFYNQGVGQNYQQGMGSQAARNQAIGQNQSAAFAKQAAMNQAQQQGYNQNMGMANFGNQALLQNQQAALANQQSLNQAQQQQYGQGMDTQAARNASIAQNQQAALARGQFTNQSQQQQFNQDLARAQFGNTAQDQSLNQQLQLRQQPLNEVMGLMGGSQIQLPQFQGYQAATKSPEEIMLAQQMQEKALMDRYGIQSANANASNTANAGLMGTLTTAAVAY